MVIKIEEKEADKSDVEKVLIFILRPTFLKIGVALFLPLFWYSLYSLLIHAQINISGIKLHDYAILSIFYYPFSSAVIVLSNKSYRKERLFENKKFIRLSIALILLFNPIGVAILYALKYAGILVLILFYIVYRKFYRKSEIKTS